MRSLLTVLLGVALAACGSDDTAAATTTHDDGAVDAPLSAPEEAGAGDRSTSSDDVVSADAAPSNEAGPSADGAPPLGVPIVAPAGKWTWVDFPDSVCDDGSPTGIGIRPSATSDKLVVFF